MKNILLLFCVIFSLCSTAQTWQWGRRGGGMESLSTNSNNLPEEVYSLATDSNGNIYGLSKVSKTNLNIDGNPKTNYGDDTSLADVALFSFTCDGTYRWSKIIGGAGFEDVNNVGVDAQNNVYIAGRFGGADNIYPQRIDTDFIMTQSPTSDYRLMFIAKFNSEGVMQWIRQPQPVGTSSTDGLTQTASSGFQVDSAGNCYWLTILPPSNYGNGAFIATQPGANWYVLKYDTNGNLVSGTYLDMQLEVTTGLSIQFSRNPYNGYYYFSSRRGAASENGVIAGQVTTKAAFIWCMNPQGQLQWLKESTVAGYYNTIKWYNFAFDPQNNVYIGGQFTGFTGETFMGMATMQFNAPPFVMKIEATGVSNTAVWVTFPNRAGSPRGAILVKDNEVAIATSGITNPYTWGGQSLVVSEISTGFETVFGRFNKDTGACLSLSRIVGDTGYNDSGTALAVDASGDYILGGAMGHNLTFANNTLTSEGGQSDFFISKFSTTPCSLGVEENAQPRWGVSPNPAKEQITVQTEETLTYRLHSLTGQQLSAGQVSATAPTVSLHNLPVGLYLLTLSNTHGHTQQQKLVIR